MVELILILGNLFLMLVCCLLHYASTSTNSLVYQLTGVTPDPDLHPWFFTVEAILLLNLIYIITKSFS